MKKNIFKLSVLIGLGLFSCDVKDDLTTPLSEAEKQEQLATAEDDSKADQEYDAAAAEAEAAIDAFEGRANGRAAVEECATVTLTSEEVSSIDPLTYIKEYSIDYGTEGCAIYVETEDTVIVRVRKGMIHVIEEAVIGGEQKKISLKRTIEFEDFYVNEVKVEGKRVNEVVFQEGENDQVSTTLTGGKLTFANGTFVTREANWTIEKTAGDNFFNEEFAVTGSASGTDRHGKAYTAEVTDALVVKRECNWFVWFPVAGTKRITSEGHTLDINFGEGECDGYLVTVSFDGGEFFEVDFSEGNE